MGKFIYKSAIELADLISSGQATSTEIVKDHLGQIKKHNPALDAVIIPLGLGKEGLPMGVQVVGPYWSEPDLIQFAKLVSEFTQGFIKPEGY